MDIKNFILENINKWNSYNKSTFKEWNTIFSLIIPLFNALGWDFSNPDDVISQYGSDKDFIDFVFFGNDNKPEILLEAKKISLNLNDEIKKGNIDLQKYFNQGKREDISIIILTNGLTYQFYTFSDKINNFIHISSLDIDFNNNLSKNIEIYVDIINNLCKESVILGCHYDFFIGVSVKEYLKIEIPNAINNDSGHEWLAEKLGVDKCDIKDILPCIFNNVFINNITINEISATESKPDIYKLKRSMIGSDSRTKRRRSDMSKYKYIWDKLNLNGFISTDELRLILEGIISTKGNSSFFRAYIGNKDDCKILVLDEESNIIKINPEVKGEFHKMVDLINNNL